MKPPFISPWTAGLALAATAALFCIARAAATREHAENLRLQAAVQEAEARNETQAQARLSRPQTGQIDELRLASREAARLRGALAQLRDQERERVRLAAENERLAARASNPPTAPVSATPDPAAAAQKAAATQCRNNLKRIALAARIYCEQHDKHYPADFASMSNELSTATLLFCPADTKRPPPQPPWDWPAMQPGRVSYRLAPGVPDNPSPNAITFQCPIHYYVALADGSVPTDPFVPGSQPPVAMTNNMLYMER